MQHSIFAVDDWGRLKLHYAGTQNLAVGDLFFNPLHNDPEVTEMLLICEGSGTYQFDGKLYSAGPRSVLFYNQGIWHEERSNDEEPYVTMFIGFSGLQLNGLPPGYFIDRALPPVFSLHEHFFAVEQRMRELVRIKLSDSAESQWIANHLLSVLLGELAAVVHHRNKPGRAEPASARIAANVKRYIHENYSRNVTLEQLAQSAAFSPYYLIRLFKKETGDSPIQYLIRYRMEAAKQYLLSTDETIGRVAELVGYESEAHFQHEFKKRIGIPPGKFRSNRRETETQELP